jgi:hypothetical protein
LAQTLKKALIRIKSPMILQVYKLFFRVSYLYRLLISIEAVQHDAKRSGGFSMLKNMVWNTFAKTGNPEFYMIFKEMEEREKAAEHGKQAEEEAAPSKSDA